MEKTHKLPIAGPGQESIFLPHQLHNETTVNVTTLSEDLLYLFAFFRINI